MTGTRIILLGDSIIDNDSYVRPGEPGIAHQIRQLLPDCTIDMRAVDGAVTAEVFALQTDSLDDADIVFLSSGGNDALGHIEFLDDAFDTTSRKALVKLREIRFEFASQYQRLIAKLNAHCARVVVMTIYNPKFEAHGMSIEDEHAAEAALSIFNDAIQQAALAHDCEVLDIRPLFTDGDDFANPIEPSAKGGAKLAAAIANRVVG